MIIEAGESSVIDFDSKGGELHLGLVDNHINSTLGIDNMSHCLSVASLRPARNIFSLT
jgi:hypothetical protein